MSFLIVPEDVLLLWSTSPRPRDASGPQMMDAEKGSLEMIETSAPGASSVLGGRTSLYPYWRMIPPGLAHDSGAAMPIKDMSEKVRKPLKMIERAM